MFPLLQVRIAELPVRPPQLQSTALLVLYLNRREYPFDRPHGEGWLIREYSDLSDLEPLEGVARLPGIRPFPIAWSTLDRDAPGWESARNLVDMTPVNDDPESFDKFFERFHTSSATKFGGYPYEIQHGFPDIDAFVFQVGTEPKANWTWADNGIGYFFKSNDEWKWTCQFH